MKEGYRVSCVKKSLAESIGSQYLFEILQTPLCVKNNENVVKSGCFEKGLRWWAPIFYHNDGRIWSLL